MQTQFGQYIASVKAEILCQPLAILLMFVIRVKDDSPSLRDTGWFPQGGGTTGLDHAFAGRFNGGQKLIFWPVVLGGAALSASGYMLMFPFVFAHTGGQQAASVVHALAGVVLGGIVLARISNGRLAWKARSKPWGQIAKPVWAARDRR